jgi:hypothetical protein
MASTAKANSLARQIKEDLSLRLSALACTLGYDASGNPQVTVGAGTAASQSAYIRVISEASSQVDALGLAQRVYTPHIIQLVLETSTIPAVALMTEANKFLLLGELLKHGTKLELYMSANANAVDASDITGTPVQVWNHLWQPLVNQI